MNTPTRDLTQTGRSGGHGTLIAYEMFARHPPTIGATHQGCFELPSSGLPCRAFTCAQKRLIRRRPLTCLRDLERSLIKVVMLVSGCGRSCGNNDAGARTLASTVIAVPHSRIKVHGVS